MSGLTQGLKVPPITRELMFSEYAPGLENVLHVWVNITNAMHEEYTRLQVKGLVIQELLTSLSEDSIEEKDKKKRKAITNQVQTQNEKMQEVLIDQYVWYSEVWSQHSDSETHETPGTVQKFAESMVDPGGDLALWKWVTTRTQALIIAHRNAYLKN